jgi:2-C-methyl-D-erythritol 4-phosphate cytidylyltransferase
MSVVVALIRAAQESALSRVTGAPPVTLAVHRLLASEVVDRIIVAVRPSEKDAVHALLREFTNIDLVVDIPPEFPDAEVLLLHDIGYPCAGAEVIRRVVDTVRATGEAVIPVLPCTDTVKQLDADGLVVGTPDRSGLRVAQYPRGLPGKLAEELLASARLVDGDPHVVSATVPG